MKVAVTSGEEIVTLDDRVSIMVHCVNRISGDPPRIIMPHEIGRYIHSKIVEEKPISERDSLQEIIISKNRFTLYLDGKKYDAAVSLDITPSGRYTVVEKWEQPYWRASFRNKPIVYMPGPSNPIGEHLIILADQYGRKINYSIHAWPLQPHADHEFRQGSYGTGCTRIKREEMKEVFENIQLGASVIVR